MRKRFIILCKFSVYIFLISIQSCAQDTKLSLKKDIVIEKKIDSLFKQKMTNEKIPGAAIIIIKNNKIILKKGYGFSNIESNKRVHPDSTIFRIGSITKTFTATALMQMVDQGTIQIDDDINTHLTSIEIPKTYKKPVTSFNLLSHSSGFDEIGRGRLVYSESAQMPLSSFLKDRIVRVRPPGEAPAYSTYGIAVAGLLVEDLTHMPLENYFKKYIWEPLGMNTTFINIPDSFNPYIAVGYEYQNGSNIRQPWEYYHTFPASSINSTIADMAKYMQAHLNDGVYLNERILGEKLSSSMKQRQISGHPKVNGFGFWVL